MARKVWNAVKSEQGTAVMFLMAIVAFAVLVMSGTTACTGPDTTEQPVKDTETTQDKTPKPKGPSERSDLKTFELDDRSAHGVTSVYVNYVITNQSSEKSDYTWSWELVDADGNRVDNGTEWVSDVRPGQTVKGDTITGMFDGPTEGLTLNVTEFDRTSTDW